MSSTWDQLKWALGISTLLSIYGIASLIVWFAGSSLGFTVTEQIVIIALLLITLPFVLLINYFYRKRKQPPAEETVAPAAAAPAGSNRHNAPGGQYEELNRGAAEAVQWLRQTKLGATKADEAVYRLPWFVFAGPPASGKTSFLLAAGLDYQTLPGQRRADLNLVRPTTDCVWRVTDWALMLDTAGRYQTDAPDSDEWSALLETIKRHRKERPLDGLVLTINAAQLLRSTEGQLEQQAKLLRARLDEVIERTRAKFPVYLVFTHLDTIEGFTDFFRAFDTSDRAQVWGTTIPLPQASVAHTLFDSEFEELYDALMRRRLLRLSAAGSPLEQLRVFDFPLRFREARHKLGLFTTTLFRPNPFSESPLLRGFYFTSSGAPRPAAVPARPAGHTDATLPLKALAETQVAGAGYFTQDFFQEILARDKDIAAAFQAQRQHPNRLPMLGFAVGGLLLFLLTIGMVVSFINNWTLIAEAREIGLRVDGITRADAGRDPLTKEPAATRDELERVELLRGYLARLDDYDRNAPPLSYRFGLYSGQNINPYLRTIYFDSINQRFFRATWAGLENDLRAFVASPTGAGRPVTNGSPSASPTATSSTDELGTYYDLLKAYLMLADPTKAEQTFLASQLAEYWQKNAAPDLALVAQTQLAFYAEQARSDDAPHVKPDQNLVAEVRRRLTAYPAINRFYKRIRTETDAQVSPITLDIILQGRGGGWLRSSTPVPGSFTLKGYREAMRDKIQTASAEIGKEDWVMGAAAGQLTGQSADVTRLQNLYWQDYVTQWQQFLKGVRVAEFRNYNEAVEALKVLSASDSPLTEVMKAIAANTNISAEESSGFFSWLFGSSSSGPAGKTPVEEQFRPLFQFTAEGEQKTAGLSQYLVELGSVRDALETTPPDQLAETSRALLTNKDDLGLQKAEVKIAKLVDPFKTPATAEAAALLKQPLGNLRALLFRGRYEEIAQTWRDQVYPRAKAIESGYPFKGGGEASVNDLALFLNPADGQLTAFFNSNLQTSFEEAQGEWRLKESGAFRFAPEFVAYLNDARRLREALFPRPDARQPQVEYGITVQPSPGADVVVEVDGNRVATQGVSPASANFIWPAKPGSASGAKFTVIPGGGQPSYLTFPGTWGLFKMLEAGRVNKTGDNEYQLSWTVGATAVRATLRPLSRTSPFDLSLFRQLRAPQSVR